MNNIFRRLFCVQYIFVILATTALSLAISSCKMSMVKSMPDPPPATDPTPDANPLDPNALQVSSRNYDIGRTGANTREIILNQSNVKPGMFGKIAELQVDDEIYAGLLYISGLFINGQRRNVLFAATTNNTVYAFDADVLGAPLWVRNVNKDFNSAGRPSSSAEVHNSFDGNVGIVGTPVIDISTKTIYFVTRTQEESAVVQRIWAIDISNGSNRVDPVVISSDAFMVIQNNQRPALAFGNDTVYVAWSSFGDAQPYHGLVQAYDSKTLALTGIFNDTPSGTMGGIWMGGGAPSLDAEGNLYYSTGNGSWNGTTQFSESVVKLKARTLDLLDWFTPYDYENLNATDADLGSSFPLILPGLNLLVTGGKDGKMYLLNSGNLGHIVNQDAQIPQSWASGDPRHGIAAWQGPAGLTLYIWDQAVALSAYRFNPATNNFILPSIATGSVSPTMSELAISSNNDKAGTGVVWATTPLNPAFSQSIQGRVLAFSAEEVGGQLPLLWANDNQADDMHTFSKYSSPLVANGRFYVPSLSKAISVYGLK